MFNFNTMILMLFTPYIFWTLQRAGAVKWDCFTSEHIVCGLIMCRVRMQAVNAVGHGAFCSPLKVVTKSLPPPPPCLECVVTGSSSLKLKWRDSRCIDLTQYILEMQRSDGRCEHSAGHVQKIYNCCVNPSATSVLCLLNEYDSWKRNIELFCNLQYDV